MTVNINGLAEALNRVADGLGAPPLGAPSMGGGHHQKPSKGIKGKLNKLLRG
jgi:hypothetical protein